MDLNVQIARIIQRAVERYRRPGEEIDFGSTITLMSNDKGEPVFVTGVVLRMQSGIIGEYVRTGFMVDHPDPSPETLDPMVLEGISGMRQARAAMLNGAASVIDDGPGGKLILP